MSENKALTIPLTKKHLIEVKRVGNLCFQEAYQEDISVYKAIIEVFLHINRL